MFKATQLGFEGSNSGFRICLSLRNELSFQSPRSDSFTNGKSLEKLPFCVKGFLIFSLSYTFCKMGGFVLHVHKLTK